MNRSRDRPSPLDWASHISTHNNYGCTSWNLRRGALLIIAVALSADAQARWCLRDGGGKILREVCETASGPILPRSEGAKGRFRKGDHDSAVHFFFFFYYYYYITVEWT
eukprot:scaffold3767_cov114-Isochrysis_galbana.AAC.19